MKTKLHDITLFTASIALVVAPHISHADETMKVRVHSVSTEGIGKSIGTITIKEHQHGALLVPDLEGLEPGLHGFHLHQNPDWRPGFLSTILTAAPW